MLNAHSYYSMRYGILTVENLIEFAVQNESEFVSLTEINSTTTLHDFLRLSKKNNIHPLWGIDFRNGANQVFVAYAKSTAGVTELAAFLSEHLHQKKEFETQAPQWKHCVTIYPFENFKKKSFELNETEYLGVTSADLPIFERSEWKSQREKALAFQTSTFQSQRHFNMHQLLRCIENNLLLSRLQPTDQGKRKDVFLSKKEIRSKFEGAPDLLDKSKAFAQQWSWSEEVNHAVSKNQNTFTGSLEEDMSLLRQLTQEGLAYRYGNEPNNRSVIQERIQKELEIIEQKNFVSYFLINWDITQFARDRGFYYVGRGSGANSVIAYLLRITDVDPIELDLYFERFINLYRQNPPDFDIDFSWTDREEITEYIFKRFQNVALLGAYNTFQYKAVVRELGKVFGLPVEEIELLSSGKFNPNTLDKNQQNVMRYASFLQDFPNSLSIHSCGILISNEPIHNYSATFLPPKGHPTVMFDMVVAEDIGLHKFDILSQRGLAKIKEAVQLVKEKYPLREIDLHQVAPLKQDERIKDLLRTANAIGCFYVESPAMRMLLTKLQVDDYLGLVAASSVIRPGVSSSGMMKEFIHRHRDPKARERAHPQLLAIMPETY
ncbi:MAG: DNA polymerase III subunit alpha, partial [Sediminibacterium sp.]